VTDRVVVGLREGAWLRVEGPGLRVEGGPSARIFRRGQPPREAASGESLDELMQG